MKRIAHISVPVQMQIIREYKEKNPDGTYRWKLSEIADNHEISLSSVNKLAKESGCQGRPRGGRVQAVPNARIMKILRDASEPFITLEQVGILNPRVVRVNGKRKEKPLSRQRVSKIIKTWRKKLGTQNIRGKGFKPGDLIEWAKQRYAVVRYDNSHRGAVIDLKIMDVIDPFCWIFQGSRSFRVEAATEELTPEAVLKKYLPDDVIKRYLGKSDRRSNSKSANRAAAK